MLPEAFRFPAAQAAFVPVVLNEESLLNETGSFYRIQSQSCVMATNRIP